MPLPELVRKLVETKMNRFCDRRVPADAKDKVRLSYSLRGNNVTLIESRPIFMNSLEWSDMKIAQFRFNPDTGNWTLYCADRNSKWHQYHEVEPTKNIEDLLKEVDEDPTCIFGGVKSKGTRRGFTVGPSEFSVGG